MSGADCECMRLPVHASNNQLSASIPPVCRFHVQSKHTPRFNAIPSKWVLIRLVVMNNRPFSVLVLWQRLCHDLLPRRSPFLVSESFSRIQEEGDPPHRVHFIHQCSPCILERLTFMVCWNRQRMQRDCESRDFVYGISPYSPLHVRQFTEYSPQLVMSR